jgi:hypothetical protein
MIGKINLSIKGADKMFINFIFGFILGYIVAEIYLRFRNRKNESLKR